MCLYLTWFWHITLQENRSITTEKIIAITTKSLQYGFIATTKKFLQAVVINSEAMGLYNKKNLVAINPKYCNEQVDAITSLLQQKQFFILRDQHRLSKKVETKIKIGSKYRDQKCIFALNI